MGLNVAILPVVTKDLPISPRFTPNAFLSRCMLSTLTTRRPMVELYSRSHAFRHGKKNTKDYNNISISICINSGSGGMGRWMGIVWHVSYQVWHCGRRYKIAGDLTLFPSFPPPWLVPA